MNKMTKILKKNYLMTNLVNRDRKHNDKDISILTITLKNLEMNLRTKEKNSLQIEISFL